MAEDMILLIFDGTTGRATAQKTVCLTEQPQVWEIHAKSADPDIAAVSLNGGELTVRAAAEGETTVTVTAKALGTGKTTEQTVSVTVARIQLWRILITAVTGIGLIVLLIFLGRPKYLPSEETEGQK